VQSVPHDELRRKFYAQTSKSAFSASSRNFDLNGNAGRSAETEQPDLRQLMRFHHVINSDKVFGTQGIISSATEGEKGK